MPGSSTTVSPGAARSIAAWSVGVSAGTWISDARRAPAPGTASTATSATGRSVRRIRGVVHPGAASRFRARRGGADGSGLGSTFPRSREDSMRRFTLLLSALGLAAAIGAAAASAGPAKMSSFRYCSDPTFPPMEYKTPSGGAVGFDVDMAKALAAHFGGKATFVQTAFPGLLPALSARKCDIVISGIFVTPDRTKQFPAVTYMRTHRALLVRAGNPEHITSPNGLKGKQVAVQS